MHPIRIIDFDVSKLWNHLNLQFANAARQFLVLIQLWDILWILIYHYWKQSIGRRSLRRYSMTTSIESTNKRLAVLMSNVHFLNSHWLIMILEFVRCHMFVSIAGAFTVSAGLRDMMLTHFDVSSECSRAVYALAFAPLQINRWQFGFLGFSLLIMFTFISKVIWRFFFIISLPLSISFRALSLSPICLEHSSFSSVWHKGRNN